MNILILEDDQTRIVKFKKKYMQHTLTFVEHAKDAIEALQNNMYNAIFLDHDLGGTQMNFDPEDCGTQVAEYIAANKIQEKTTIIIHSFNQPASLRMLALIGENCQYVPGLWL